MGRYRGEHQVTSVMCSESGCSHLSVVDIDGLFDSPLCEDHLWEAYRENAADDAVKYAKENRAMFT